MITVLLTEVFKTIGGISRFNSFLLRALCETIRESDAKVRVLSLNDGAMPPGSLTDYTAALNGQFKFYGAQHNKISFVLESMRQALSSDLVIVGHTALAPLGLMFNHLRSDLRYAVITHGIEAWKVDSPLERKGLDHANFILSVSRFTRDKLIGQGFSGEKIKLLPNTVDGKLFFPARRPERLMRKYGFDAQDRIVLMVGRLKASEIYKGFDVVMHSLQRAVSTQPYIKLVIVGSGDDQPRLENLASDLGLAAHVTFAGLVPDEELPDYYNLCDLFVMPSKKEGFGIVFLEALACGKPVVAGNKDGSQDALLDGKLGTLVDPDDVGAVTAAILNVLNASIRPPLLDRNFLRRTVLEHYGFERFRARLSGYVELLSNQSSSAQVSYFS